MGMKRRPPKVFLFAKPKRAPKWWPRDENGKAREVVVVEEGCGWSTAGSRKNKIHAHEAKEIGEIFEMMFDRKFVFRVVKA